MGSRLSCCCSRTFVWCLLRWHQNPPEVITTRKYGTELFSLPYDTVGRRIFIHDTGCDVELVGGSVGSTVMRLPMPCERRTSSSPRDISTAKAKTLARSGNTSQMTASKFGEVAHVLEIVKLCILPIPCTSQMFTFPTVLPPTRALPL